MDLHVWVFADYTLDRGCQRGARHCRHEPNENVPRNPRKCPHRIVARFDIAQDLDAAAVISVGRRRGRDLAFLPVEKLDAESLLLVFGCVGKHPIAWHVPARRQP